MTTIRQQRVAGLLFEELSIMLNGELSDPRVSLITVTSVEVSKDLRNAKVHIYHQNEELSRKEVLAGLRSATPYLRGELASRCGLRMVPEVLFYYDETPERAARIDELLNQIAQERTQHEESKDEKPEAETVEGDSTSNEALQSSGDQS